MNEIQLVGLILPFWFIAFNLLKINDRLGEIKNEINKLEYIKNKEYLYKIEERMKEIEERK